MIAGIPDTLREELFGRFNDVVRNFRRRHWEASLLNAGKFCEAVYTILKGRSEGHFPARAEKPSNMVEACRKLEHTDDAKMGRALRIQIPRAILPIYEIRNNRGTGHAGAEIDPNSMDAAYAVQACRWILSDLVRSFHKLDTDQAASVVEQLTRRELPLVWSHANTKRVLDPRMEIRDRILALLYDEAAPVQVERLQSWTGYKNAHRFKGFLKEMDRQALVLFEEVFDTAFITPVGEAHVEERALTATDFAR